MKNIGNSRAPGSISDLEYYWSIAVPTPDWNVRNEVTTAIRQSIRDSYIFEILVVAQLEHVYEKH